MFVRPLVYERNLKRQGRAGDGFMAMPLVVTNAEAGAQTISVEQILGGVAKFTGAAGAVTYTTPTAAALLEVFPNMDIGDTYVFSIVNTAAQTATIAGGTKVTAVTGLLTLNASGGMFMLERSDDDEFNLYRIG